MNSIVIATYGEITAVKCNNRVFACKKLSIKIDNGEISIVSGNVCLDTDESQLEQALKELEQELKDIEQQ